MKYLGSEENRQAAMAVTARITKMEVSENRRGELQVNGEITNGAAKALVAAIDSKHVIEMSVWEGSSKVDFDDMIGVMDIGDFKVAADTSEKGAQAVFAHAFAEQLKLMEMGGRTKNNYHYGGHAAGEQAENAIMGSNERKLNTISRRLSAAFGKTVPLEVTYLHNNRAIEKISYEID